MPRRDQFSRAVDSETRSETRQVRNERRVDLLEDVGSVITLGPSQYAHGVANNCAFLGDGNRFMCYGF
jgi:hypothetical protein